jgi:transposase
MDDNSIEADLKILKRDLKMKCPSAGMLAQK